MKLLFLSKVLPGYLELQWLAVGCFWNIQKVVELLHRLHRRLLVVKHRYYDFGS